MYFAEELRKWPTDIIEQKFFSFITSEILRLKENNKFSDSSFAVLVNDRYQAERLKNYFYKFSISSTSTKASSLKNSLALKAMRDFFYAVLYPFDFNKIKIALKGPFLRFSDEQIKDIEYLKELSMFNEFNFLKLQLEKGFGVFFKSFFSCKLTEKTIFENIALIHSIFSLI